MKTKVAVFKGQKVRKTIHNNEWWFVVEDVVVALTDTVNAKDYINKMRLRDEALAKGYGQFVHTLLMEKRIRRPIVSRDNFLGQSKKVKKLPYE